MSEPENGISLIISMLEYYKKRLLGLENDKDLHYDIIEDGVKTLTKKINNALNGITESKSESIIKVHREVVSLALNFYLQELQKNEDVFNDKLYSMGDLIKQRDPELFEEIIRTMNDQISLKKIKVEINRAKRIRN